MIRTFSIFVLLCSMLSGCAEPEAVVRPPVTVSVSAPVIRSVDSYVEINGRSEASEIFEARARVAGVLMPAEDGKKRFAEGEPVAKGQELFLIEPEPYEATVQAAKARLASAEAQKTLAETTYERSKSLYEKSAITRAELDEREAEFNVAQAAILQESSALKQAEIEFGYTTIQSEVEGIIGESLVDEGNIVGVGEFTLLATVRKTDPLHLYFDAAERVVLNFLRKLSEGDARKIQEITLEIGFEGEDRLPPPRATAINRQSNRSQHGDRIITWYNAESRPECTSRRLCPDSHQNPTDSQGGLGQRDRHQYRPLRQIHSHRQRRRQSRTTSRSARSTLQRLSTHHCLVAAGRIRT